MAPTYFIHYVKAKLSSTSSAVTLAEGAGAPAPGAGGLEAGSGRWLWARWNQERFTGGGAFPPGLVIGYRYPILILRSCFHMGRSIQDSVAASPGTQWGTTAPLPGMDESPERPTA